MMVRYPKGLLCLKLKKIALWIKIGVIEQLTAGESPSYQYQKRLKNSVSGWTLTSFFALGLLLKIVIYALRYFSKAVSFCWLQLPPNWCCSVIFSPLGTLIGPVL